MVLVKRPARRPGRKVSREAGEKTAPASGKEMAAVVDEDSKMVQVSSTRDLVARGYKPIVHHLVEMGFKEGEMAEVLAEEYGVVVEKRALKGIVRRVPKDAAGNVAKQELAELRQLAIEQLHSFKRRMDEAEVDGNMRKFRLAASEFREWWDRMGRFHFKEEKLNIQVGDNYQQMALILDKLADDPAKYEETVGELRNEED